jgi:hypothetical protein
MPGDGNGGSTPDVGDGEGGPIPDDGNGDDAGFVPGNGNSDGGGGVSMPGDEDGGDDGGGVSMPGDGNGGSTPDIGDGGGGQQAGSDDGQQAGGGDGADSGSGNENTAGQAPGEKGGNSAPALDDGAPAPGNTGDQGNGGSLVSGGGENAALAALHIQSDGQEQISVPENDTPKAIHPAISAPAAERKQPTGGNAKAEGSLDFESAKTLPATDRAEEQPQDIPGSDRLDSDRIGSGQLDSGQLGSGRLSAADHPDPLETAPQATIMPQAALSPPRPLTGMAMILAGCAVVLFAGGALYIRLKKLPAK